MADEIGFSKKISGPLPADPMRDSGGNPPGTEIPFRRRKKVKPEALPVGEGGAGDSMEPDGNQSLGKILDIEI